MITILDCYTDEPAGLGVPPFIGTYPRYIAGYYGGDVKYITIDDLRFFKLYDNVKKELPKTNIKVYNLTRNSENLKEVLESTDELVIVLGVHTPGKYLSAIPGTLREVMSLLNGFRGKKILTGPAIYGTQLEGGRFSEKTDLSFFDEVRKYDFSYDEIAEYAVKGSTIIGQIPDIRIAEIETGKGCNRKIGCSFCTEPLKNKVEFREQKDIIAEVKALHSMGVEHFRLGKQSCFFSYKDGKADEIEKLLQPIAVLKPKTLHIDNVNPARVTKELVKLTVKYCTEGNIAAFGVESFDPAVCEANNLNTRPEIVMRAVRIMNEYGAERGPNGMPKFLPGINILLGLKGETKKTLQLNYEWLKKILDEGLMIRRINIRKVVPFEGTRLYEEVGNKYLRKNSRLYYSFKRKIREEIDHEFLKRLTPEGLVLKDVRMEVHDGNNTFGRQLGTYPLIVGVKEKLELGKFYDVKVTSHMLRSIVGEVY